MPEVQCGFSDAGAFDCAIDKSLAERIKLPLVEQTNLAGIGGSYYAGMYAAQIHIPALSHTIYGEFAGIDMLGGGQQHEALIGRTFLRQCRMTYDGVTGGAVISRN